jgi:hypothetical protein
VQGWQLIVESIEKAYGFGIGFQQLGIHGTEVQAAEAIYAVSGLILNTTDGGFTFAKLVSEMGLLGLFLLFWYSWIALRAFKLLRGYIQNKIEIKSSLIFSCCIILSYSIELLIRGAGYFTPMVLLLIASIRVFYAEASSVKFQEDSDLCNLESPPC